MNILWILKFCLILRHWELVSGLVESVEIQGSSEIIEGETLTLTCVGKCVNSSTCTYKWSGYQIPAPTNKPVLTFVNINRINNEKVYTCVVTDAQSNQKQTTKKIVVYYGPLTVSVGAGEPLTVIKDNTYRSHNLSCTASECNPLCNTFKWFRSNDTNTIITQEKRLFPINKIITRSDTGSYVCSASNTKGLNKTGTIQITVNYPPDITLTWSKNSSTLTCKAEGVPNQYTFDTIDQYHGSILLNSYNPGMSENTATLRFDNTNYQMTGTYFCNVSNGIGSKKIESKAISIEDKPQLVNYRDSYNVSKGSKLDVLIDIYSLPQVKKSDIGIQPSTSGHNNSLEVLSLINEIVLVTFYKKEISKLGQRLVLRLETVLEEDFTEYTVEIGNSKGVATASITIFPEGPPDVPTKFTKDDTSPHSVSFTLVTGFFNGGEQTIVVEHRLKGQPEWSNRTYKFAGDEQNKRENLEVTDLEPETEYEFRAYAFNEYDHSNYTEVIREKTQKEPSSAAVIAGGVVGGLAFIILISVLVVFLLRRRKKRKEINGDMNRSQNEDLTLNMPTSPVYENNCRSAENMLAEEDSTCPVSPDQPSDIYENTNVETGNVGNSNAALYDIPPPGEGVSRVSPYASPQSNKSLYKTPQSNAKLYDVPNAQKGGEYNNQSQKHLYDNPRSKKNLYDLPKSNKEVNKSKHGYQKSDFDSGQARGNLYDNPLTHGLSHGTSATGKSSRDSVDAMPSYLDLNNPNPNLVEEAYVDVIQTSALVKPNKEKPRFGKQETLSEDDYLDMNEVNTAKESPYVNTKHSSVPRERLDDGSKIEGKDYQNVEQFKKSKRPPVAKKPSKNGNKVLQTAISESEEDSKDYQNVNKYKKVNKEPSVESAELYMTMSTETNRQSVASLPGFYAPPPPPVLEEDYMNLRINKPKK